MHHHTTTFVFLYRLASENGAIGLGRRVTQYFEPIRERQQDTFTLQHHKLRRNLLLECHDTSSKAPILTISTQAEVPDRNQICPDRSRRKVPMSRPSQTQSAYVQTVPDGKWICPDFRAFQIFRAFFVRSKTNMSRPSQTETVYVQTFVRSCPDHRALQLKFVRSTPNFSCVHVQTIVRSCPDHRAFKSRPSCVHVQTFVRSSVFPDRVILNARHPLRAFISVWTYLVSVWDLSLGRNCLKSLSLTDLNNLFNHVLLYFLAENYLSNLDFKIRLKK